MEPIVNIVLPVFAIIAVGYAAGYFRLLGSESSEALNLFVYWVALPVLLFRAMATVELDRLLNGPFIAAYIGGVIVIWLLALALGRMLFGNSPGESAMHGMNGVYSNTGYMGIPLAIAAYGQTAALPAILATVINSAVVMAFAVLLLEFGQKRGGGAMTVVAVVARSLVANPMIVAPLAGVLWAASGVALPGPLASFTQILGAAAGPCALFAIGLFLVGRPMAEGLGEVSAMVALKLGLQPALTAVLVFTILPVEPLWAKMAILMAALPTGAGSFVLAQAYGVYVQRTSAAILLSTVLSVFTVSAFFLIFPPGG